MFIAKSKIGLSRDFDTIKFYQSPVSIDLKSTFVSLLTIILLMVSAVAGNAESDTVAVGNYQIRVQYDPAPPVVGQDTRIILKIIRRSDNAPAKQGKVLIRVFETTDNVAQEDLNAEDFSTFAAAVPADEFGNYEYLTVFRKHAPHTVELVITELDGTLLETPVHAGFSILVAPPDRSGLRLWSVLAVFLFFTFVAVYIIHVRKNIPTTDPNGFNLLDIPWLRKILVWKYTQPLLQIPLLLSFAFLIYISFFDIQDGGKNLATKLIWAIWWAGVIFTFVLVGRLWCYMCPIGALSEWTSRIMKPGRRFPPALRNIWIANMLFFLLTWIDITFGVVGNPYLTGVLFVALTFIAVVTALFYQRRTFCRYICPIGGLIGIYSLFSAVELRSMNCETCKTHKQKDCYTGNENGRGCPMFELVPTMDSNRACNFCGECVKSCPRDNFSLRFRPFFRDAWTTTRHSLDEAALAIVLVGVTIFVTGDMLKPWAGWMEKAMGLVPAELLGMEYNFTIEVTAKSVLFITLSLIIIPGLMLLASHASNRFAGPGNHDGLKATFISFSYMFIPIGLSMHLAHNLGHLLGEAGGIVPALQRAVILYTPFSAGEPDWLLAAEPLVDASMLYWMQMITPLVFYCFSLFSGYKLVVGRNSDGVIAFRSLLPMVALSFNRDWI